jgi:hypothetical protein
MGIGNARIRQVLSESLDPHDYDQLVDSYEYSSRRIQEIAAVIKAAPEFETLERRDWGYAVIGSLGRMEAGSDESDADLILLCDSREATISDEARHTDGVLRDLIRRKLGIKVSQGQQMTSPTSVDSIADAKLIGGENDNVNLLTKRILLLLESRAVVRPERVEKTRRGIFNAFSEASVTAGKHLESLANDIGRYYRTVCVDYKSRVDHEGKPWAIRNVKLRHRSKYLYFSTMLAMVGATTTGRADEEVYEQLSMTPTERLVVALERTGLLSATGNGATDVRRYLSIVAHLNHFVSRLGEPAVRAELEKIDYDSRHSSAAFRDLRQNSRSLSDAMLAIIYDLPKEMRDHLLRLFLL